jgi:hypothetical protein
MTSFAKLLDRILLARSDQNIRFEELCRLLTALGFASRIKGSHHIFHHPQLIEIVNLQPLANGQAKAYQVRQVRKLITDYGLTLPEER